MKEDIYHRPITTHGGQKYIRTIQGLRGTPSEGVSVQVDVYKVLLAFNVTCPATAQAVKKLLCAGLRGKGSRVQDIRETFDALFRALEEAEAEEVSRGPLPGVPAANPIIQSGALSVYTDEEIRSARLLGYEGDPCGRCGGLTLVRSGDAVKCDHCDVPDAQRAWKGEV